MYHCSVSYTQRETSASHLANKAPSYNQQRANIHPQKKKREQKKSSDTEPQMKHSCADKGVANQNTQRKQTKQEGGLKKKEHKLVHRSTKRRNLASDLRCWFQETKVTPKTFNNTLFFFSFLRELVSR